MARKQTYGAYGKRNPWRPGISGGSKPEKASPETPEKASPETLDELGTWVLRLVGIERVQDIDTPIETYGIIRNEETIVVLCADKEGIIGVQSSNLQEGTEFYEWTRKGDIQRVEGDHDKRSSLGPTDVDNIRSILEDFETERRSSGEA